MVSSQAVKRTLQHASAALVLSWCLVPVLLFGTARLEDIHVIGPKLSSFLDVPARPHHFIPVKGLSPNVNGTRIAFLSDTHWSDGHRRGVSTRTLQLVADEVAAFRPQLVFLGGDFADNHNVQNFSLFTKEFVVPLMKRLNAMKCQEGDVGCKTGQPFKAKAYAILGNHDLEPWRPNATRAILEALQEAGVHILFNAAVQPFGSAELSIIGMADWWYQYNTNFLRTATSLRNYPAEDAKDGDHEHAVVVLSHNPDSNTDIATWPRRFGVRPHLTLSGHTHGGTACLPHGLRQIAPHAVPALRSYQARIPGLNAIKHFEWSYGLNRVALETAPAGSCQGNESMYSYTSSGLDRFPPRWLCSAEVATFTLVASPSGT